MISSIIGTLLATAVIVALEKRSLSGSRKKWITFGSLLIIGITLNILQASRLDIPSPLHVLEAVFKPVNSVLIPQEGE